MRVLPSRSRIPMGISLVTMMALFTLAPAAALAVQGGCEGPLKIMLTNDDGFDAPGIMAMRAALQAVDDFDVTVVAPLEQQSGKGGSLTVDVGGPIAIKEEEPGVWSVDGTPVDSVRVGLTLVLADDPPDLIVSGSNFGQNTGRGVASGSGTVGAAYAATNFDGGFPAIDISVEIKLEEAADGFPSTFAAFPEAGNFTARLIQELQANCRGGQLLIPRGQLHVNYPALSREQIPGVAFETLGAASSLNLDYIDPLGAVAARGGDVIITFALTDPSEFEGDVLALSQGFIAVVLMDGDMNARNGDATKLSNALKNLTP